MFFKYGTYTHPENEVNLTSLNQVTRRNARGGVESTRKTLSIQGTLLADTQTALSAAIVELENAYQYEGQDAGLYQDDGAGGVGVKTPHFLNSSASLGGVKIQSLTYPQGTPSEYATQRTFAITLFADFPGDGGLVSFEETLSFQGTGGPSVVNVVTIAGLGQKQSPTQFTRRSVIQQGSAVGYGAYPAQPPPMFPTFEVGERRREDIISPQNNNGEFINWGIRWSYYFEQIGPGSFSRNPNRR